jgi:hypothetical protein
MKKRMLAIAAAMVLSAGAQAAPIFSDNFDSDPLGLNAIPAGWSIGNAGAVDVIGAPGFFDLIPGNGHYIDLDGSNGLAGMLVSDPTGSVSGTFTATFQLGGNHRDGTTDMVAVSFGDASIVIAVGPNDAFTTYSLTTTVNADQLSLSFLDGRDGNVGALLDSASISAVLEPGSLSLMLAGIAALGFAARRRRS